MRTHDDAGTPAPRVNKSEHTWSFVSICNSDVLIKRQAEANNAPLLNSRATTLVDYTADVLIKTFFYLE